mmetsp:Transcript_9676/g.11018  ORF Transcript_9676/g.11018 Transcript_9676/m.11018 type:complete len:356 (+) Transcript_9676:561-1628(+)|eukprot:CAMPEP_0184009556 /NCGR_PEP_ID=MMETSP0954-20121128/2678_1 /TAXON_ID=627963 /ORGANISM="Aplanochytrium sp, Strain PBS07" /LENGTH=355 /DNA_ID=CAMNT_0026288957 /DNA_START=514 /DNA_END=1581 /DNA_ORIENTATION=+
MVMAVHNGTDREFIPVLLITDIGADIDDTLATLVLHGAPRVKVVGVVTSVNDGKKRGALMRGWLRKLGVADGDVPILPSVDSNGEAGCHTPDGFPAVEDAALGKVEETPFQILRIAEKYDGELAILGIAPLTPLAAAIRLDTTGILKKIKRIYLQGNVHVNEKIGVLKPDALAYNFRMDMEAATMVFDALQLYVPFTLLGKFAAFRVGLTKKDFERFTRSDKPSLLCQARNQMNNFRIGNPELFYKLYPIPEKFKELDSMEWFDHIKGGTISHPYDPLLALSVVEDSQVDLFADAADSSPKELFTRDPVLCNFPEKRPLHYIIGNTETEHGIPDPSRVHHALVQSLMRGLDRNSN